MFSLSAIHYIILLLLFDPLPRNEGRFEILINNSNCLYHPEHASRGGGGGEGGDVVWWYSLSRLILAKHKQY